MTAPAQQLEPVLDWQVPHVAHAFPPNSLVALCGVTRRNAEPMTVDSVRCRSCLRIAETHGRSLSGR
jgi:hypothetical protein